jgi:glycosyltransferase involved in cell wall biosynthesis
VHFLDHSGDPKRISGFLNTLDLFAHGRRDGETFGTVLAEAMMHGKPCLSHYSSIGANAQPETMGPAGLFAHDEKDYAEKLERLFADDGLRRRLAAEARPRAEALYSAGRCVGDLSGLYESLCGSASRRAALHWRIRTQGLRRWCAP